MKIKKIVFMLNKFKTDILSPRKRYSIVEDIHSPTLGKYYFDFDEQRVRSGKDQKLIAKFDKNGIPLNKTYIDVEGKDYVYFPISIGQSGLAVFHTYLKTKSEIDRNRYLKYVDWFFENKVEDSTLGVHWLTEVPLPQYHNPGPWQSAFVQARGIAILLRGYQLTTDERYRQAAELALIPFTKPVAEGGVTSFTEWGPFYEEYTSTVPTLVLNGMIFSLLGLKDFVRVLPGNELANKLFNDGVQTLKNILPEFDLIFWSRYNLCHVAWYPAIDPATISYQRLHIVQLELMYRLTGDEYFQMYVEKFKAQDTFINAIKMYRIKFKSLKKINRL
jgi:hypothetical protein